MPSIKDLEMAGAVSSHQNITVKKSFFGLSQKVIYEPTQSPVSVLINEYAPGDGERLEHLLSLPLDKLAAELKAKGKPAPAGIGQFRLEACLSADHRFCALQLFRFGDFKYTPSSEVRFFEGKDVETVAGLL